MPIKGLGFIVKEIPYDTEGCESFSHWAIIHTSWGICKLLIPKDKEAEVVVKVCMFGTDKAEEVTFKGERDDDVVAFTSIVEQRLTNAVIKNAELECRMYVANNGRLQ